MVSMMADLKPLGRMMLLAAGLSWLVGAATPASAASSPDNDASNSQHLPATKLAVKAPAAALKQVATATPPLESTFLAKPAGQPVLNLSIPPLRKLMLDEATRSNDTALAGEVANAASDREGSLTDKGAVFVPLLKQAPRSTIAADPLARGDFVERHEFGIELRSPF